MANLTLTSKEEMLNKLKKDNDIIEWSVNLGMQARKGRFEELKSKGIAK